MGRDDRTYAGNEGKDAAILWCKEWLHVKSGRTYSVAGTSLDATNETEGRIMVRYYDKHGSYVRELDEFLLKFEPLD